MVKPCSKEMKCDVEVSFAHKPHILVQLMCSVNDMFL